jgi:hypothetical protein
MSALGRGCLRELATRAAVLRPWAPRPALALFGGPAAEEPGHYCGDGGGCDWLHNERPTLSQNSVPAASNAMLEGCIALAEMEEKRETDGDTE